MILSELKIGQKGTILGIQSKELEIILLGLGLRTGDQFLLTDAAPFGGPLALRTHGTKIAIGRGDAAKVLIRRV